MARIRKLFFEKKKKKAWQKTLNCLRRTKIDLRGLHTENY